MIQQFLRRDLPHHRGVFALFFLYALSLGGILSRIAEVQLAMNATAGALGVGLLGFALGTQITLIAGSGVIAFLGPHRTVLLSMVVLAFGQIGASLAGGIPVFFLMLMVAGIGIGALEIIVNLEADRAEVLLGRRIMSRAHSFWSFGFFAAGATGVAAASMRLAVPLHLLLLNTGAIALTLLVLKDFRAAPARVAMERPHARFVRPSKAIMGLVAVCLSAMLLEGAASDWSIIYMRDTFATPAGISGLALAISALAQASTRFFADHFVDRFGPVNVVRNLLILLGLGALLVTFAPWPGIALAGFALMGIGTATIFPLAMSAAAQRTDRPAAENVASLAQTAFVTFLVTPPLLGFIAQHIGIRAAFALGLPLVVLSLVFVKLLVPSVPAAAINAAAP